MPGKWITRDRKRDLDFLDCGSNTVVAGLWHSEAGQLTRLYFESYGRPDFGDHDKGLEIWRVTDLRAVNHFRRGGDRNATILFEDEDGTEYIYTKRSNLEQPDFEDKVERLIAEHTDIGDDYVLARKEDREIVGVNVSFAIPDNRNLSQQLPERDAESSAG